MKLSFRILSLLLAMLTVFTLPPLAGIAVDESADDGMNMSDNSEKRIGTWWWYKSDGNDSELRKMYLDFLQQAGVNEIYYYDYTSLANQEFDNIHAFVQDAMSHGMRVAILFDDPEAATDPNHTYMYKLKDGYFAYKTMYPEDALYGLHFDIEPGYQTDVLQAYCDNFITKVTEFREAGICCEIDVACGWGGNGASVNLGELTGIYNIIASNCDTMTLMSYRDSAEAILSFGQNAYNSCVEYGCDVLFGVETGDYGEGDYVDFSAETKEYMLGEMDKVFDILDSRELSIGYGMAIHNHRTFYNMQGDLPSKELSISDVSLEAADGNYTLTVTAKNGNGAYTYFYYLISDDKIADSELYSTDNTVTFEAKAGDRVRVYVQDGDRKRAVEQITVN